ncbi:unnamed protein product [Mycetohabitans rhizoxinica HKI 454]|uniref:Uncharacterized protein n=1 Tax=Mycetohabitans rhizoxinica (strain DSM 19002 / CIP 109453 / HKI 454) TaxID=882378 RepID=E5ARQ4_MYCRK|nr:MULTISPECIES: hypothetical protein [Mycetohabitans]MCG1047316.1 hypothetical protein [Mycetohabitans sp. B6]CBW75286.1 unnamed protein product [Mycetohabitans rhizoxinica HKI 454]
MDPLKLVVLDGDTVQFDTTFGPAVALNPPVAHIAGSGQFSVNGKKVCISGDEASVKVPGVTYQSGIFMGGVGEVVIEKLQEQTAPRVVGGKPVMVKGVKFLAKLKVISKAKSTSSPPQEDPMSEYLGTGEFITESPTRSTYAG